jgi:probable phosphoglycerate mutase
MRLYLVRHGETEWTRARRHTGRTDVPLTAGGEAEARALGRLLAGVPVGRVLSSPLRRALVTARLAGFGDRVEVSDALREWDYGEYEGRTTAEIRRERPGWDLFRDGCPGGEVIGQVAGRARPLVDKLRAAGEDAMLFGHGHELRVLAVVWLGAPLEIARHLVLSTGSVSLLGSEHDWPAILRWNQSSGGNLG